MSDSDSLSDSDKENGGLEDGDGRVPLLEDQIEEKLSQLKAQKQATKENRQETNNKISEMRRELRDLTLKDKLESEIKSVCIKGRNTYSRQAIKEDFAMGIKE